MNTHTHNLTHSSLPRLARDLSDILLECYPSVTPVERGAEWKSTTFPDTSIVHWNVTFQSVDNQDKETETLCETNNDKTCHMEEWLAFSYGGSILWNLENFL